MDMNRIAMSLFGLSLAMLPSAMLAQQPGTAAYNQVLLPAHGVGDTKRSELAWGSFAMSDENSLSGWGLNARSEREARDQAIRVCSERGVRCEVLFVFADSCAAIAVNETESFSSAGGSLEDVRQKSLQRCGKDCEIFQERCSLPR